MFIKLKQIEAKFNILYKATIKIDREYADKTLYEGLSELIESENIQTKLLEFSCRGLYASKYSPQKEAKKILDFIFPDPNEAEPSIIMMPSAYSLNEKQAEQVSNEELSQEELDEIKQREERYAAEFNSKKPTEGKEYQRFITIPPLDYMAPSVFKLFRAQNQDILAEYNNYINQWIHLWDKHTTDESVMKDIAEMEEKICGLQVRIEKELQENELFRMSIANLNYDGYRATKIALSKIQISDLWELYETHKVFEKETIDALKSMASTHVHYKNNIPVIICFPFIWQTDEMEEREKKAETISIPVSKKSISID